MQKFLITCTIDATVEAESHEQAQSMAHDHLCWSNAEILVEEVEEDKECHE